MTPLPIGRRVAAESLGSWPSTAVAALDLLVRQPIALRRALRLRDETEFQHAFHGWARRVIARLQVDLRLDGFDSVDPTGAYVIVALHESFIDVPVVAHLPMPLVFSARSELLEWRTLGRFLSETGQIVIPDGNPHAGLRALLREGTAHLETGRSVVVFPQASVLGIETGFQAGAFHLARHAGVRILPVVVAGGHQVWDYPFSPVVRLGQPVFARALAPVHADEADSLEASMKQIALANTHAAPRRFEPLRDGWWDGYRYEIDAAFPELADRHRRHLDATAAQAEGIP